MPALVCLKYKEQKKGRHTGLPLHYHWNLPVIRTALPFFLRPHHPLPGKDAQAALQI